MRNRSQSSSSFKRAALSFTFLLVVVILLNEVSLTQAAKFKVEPAEPSDYLYAAEVNSRVVEYLKPTLDDELDPKEEISEEGWNYNWHHPSFLDPSSSSSNDDGMPRIVEFYSPWCSHCVNYKPHYIQLAKDSERNYSYVKFYAISCSVHSQICRDQDIVGYPTLKYISPRKKGTSVEDGVGHVEIVNKAGLTPDKLYKEFLEDDGYPVQNGEESSKGTSNVNIEIETETKTGDEGGKQKSDTTPTTKNKVGITSLRTPTSKTKSSEMSLQEAVYHDATTSFRYALRNAIYISNGPLTKQKAKSLKSWLNLVQKTLPPKTSKHHKHSNNNNNNNMTPLMIEHINYIQDVIAQLLKNWHDIKLGEKYLLRILSNVDAVYPSLKKGGNNDKWSVHCSHDESRPFVGYTCGLWELFHLISVGLVELPMGGVVGYDAGTTTKDSEEEEELKVDNDGETNSVTRISTMEAGDTLRDYIRHFFACEECRKNFLATYDDCKFDRCTRLSYDDNGDEDGGEKRRTREFALWLWEVHNDVTMRLYREDRREDGGEGEVMDGLDPKVLAVRWPSVTDCKRCWNEEGDGSWDEEEVYQYLEGFYWPQSSSTKKVLAKHNPVQAHQQDDNQTSTLQMIMFASISALCMLYFKKRSTTRRKRTGRSFGLKYSITNILPDIQINTQN